MWMSIPRGSKRLSAYEAIRRRAIKKNEDFVQSRLLPDERHDERQGADAPRQCLAVPGPDIDQVLELIHLTALDPGPG